jgi:hypothetical protein
MQTTSMQGLVSCQCMNRTGFGLTAWVYSSHVNPYHGITTLIVTEEGRSHWTMQVKKSQTYCHGYSMAVFQVKSSVKESRVQIWSDVLNEMDSVQFAHVSFELIPYTGGLNVEPA